MHLVSFQKNENKNKQSSFNRAIILYDISLNASNFLSINIEEKLIEFLLFLKTYHNNINISKYKYYYKTLFLLDDYQDNKQKKILDFFEILKKTLSIPSSNKGNYLTNMKNRLENHRRSISANNSLILTKEAENEVYDIFEDKYLKEVIPNLNKMYENRRMETNNIDFEDHVFDYTDILYEQVKHISPLICNQDIDKQNLELSLEGKQFPESKIQIESDIISILIRKIKTLEKKVKQQSNLLEKYKLKFGEIE